VSRAVALALAIAGLAATASTARADEPGWLRGLPGAGWSSEPEVGRRLTADVRRSWPDATDAGVRAFRAPGPIALYVSWVERPGGVAAVRAGFDAIRAARVVANPEPGATIEHEWREEIAGGWVAFEHRWQHLANRTYATSRGAATTKAGVTRLAWGECVLPTDAGEAAIAACVGTLDALAILPVGDPIELPPATPPPEPGAAAATDAPAAAPAAAGGVLYAGAAPPPKRSGRWLIVAGAACLLIAFILVARRRAAPPPGSRP
jgi:hypothetical protein